MQELLDVAKALSDPNRVRMVMLLKDRELCLCQVIEMIGLASSTVSKHMDILRRAGLVESRKEGRWHYYRLPGKSASRLVRRTLRLLQQTLLEDPVVEADARRLQAVLRMDRKELCNHYKS